MRLILILCISLILICGFVFLFFNSVSAAGASFYIYPSSGNFIEEDIFTVGIYVSAGQAINAVSGVINFPKEKLEMTDVSADNSIINYWIREPVGSNIDGTVRFEGVSLNPGFIGPEGKILSITFRVLRQGWYRAESERAVLTLSEASVLANDGFGTEILTGISGAQFSLLSLPEPTVPIQPPAQEEKIPPPEFKLEIKPKVFPKPSVSSPAPEIEIKPEMETTTKTEAVKPLELLVVTPPSTKIIDILKSYLPAIVGFIILIFVSLIIFYEHRHKK